MKNVFGSLREFITRHSRVNWALADQAMVSGVNFLTGILLARYLGLHEFGVFTLAWMSVLFVNSLQYALIISPMVSIGSKQSEEQAPLYFSAVAVQQVAVSLLSFALIFACVLVFGMFFPQWDVQHLALPLAASAFTFQSQDFIRLYFFTRNRPAAAFVNDGISYGGQIALLLWLFSYGAATSANVLWIVAATSAIAVVLGIKQMERLQWPSAGYLKSVCQRSWLFSKWLTASALMQWTSSNFFTIVVAVYLGSSAAGAMRACQSIMGALHILFYGLENVVPLRAAKTLHSDGVKAMRRYLGRVTLIGGGFSAIFTVIAASAPEFWLHVFYGMEYSGYGFVLQWYALIYFLMFFSTPLRAGFRALEYTKPHFWAYVLATIFTFVLCVPLISNFGLVGAMIGLLCTNLIHRGFMMVALVKRMKSLL